jgi:hypothetical protein
MSNYKYKSIAINQIVNNISSTSLYNFGIPTGNKGNNYKTYNAGNNIIRRDNDFQLDIPPKNLLYKINGNDIRNNSVAKNFTTTTTTNIPVNITGSNERYNHYSAVLIGGGGGGGGGGGYNNANSTAGGRGSPGGWGGYSCIVGRPITSNVNIISLIKGNAGNGGNGGSANNSGNDGDPGNDSIIREMSSQSTIVTSFIALGGIGGRRGTTASAGDIRDNAATFKLENTYLEIVNANITQSPRGGESSNNPPPINGTMPTNKGFPFYPNSNATIIDSSGNPIGAITRNQGRGGTEGNRGNSSSKTGNDAVPGTNGYVQVWLYYDI